MRLGFSPWGNGTSPKPFDALFSEYKSLSAVPVASCDAIIMWGGTDIHPDYYAAQRHPRSGAVNNSDRDQAEWTWMQEAVELGIPIIGVCRGAQFLCALAGGRLVQDVNGHHGTHDVLVKNEQGGVDVMGTSSCHHQMMYIAEVPDAEMLAWCNHRSTHYEGETKDQILSQEVDPEVVYFPSVKGFAIQGHPEWMYESSPFVQWCLKTIDAKLLSKVEQ